MKHTDTVTNYPGNNEELVEALGNLYYDSLADFLRQLSEKMQKDGEADSDRGRPKLAAELLACSQHLQVAAKHIDAAWIICKPYVDK